MAVGGDGEVKEGTMRRVDGEEEERIRKARRR